MSGSGYHVFTPGEVLTDTNVNGYLMKQSVMSFATTAARDAAITSPEEGMYAEARDVDIAYRYDGSSWIPVWYGKGWTTYTPSWTSTGTAPGLGNGTLTGKYFQQGKTVYFHLFFQAGSTSTYGTGNYAFSLPVNANTTITNTVHCRVLDSSAGSAYPGMATIFSSTIVPQTPTTGSPAVLNTVTNTSPMTFTTSDEVRAWGIYEAS